MQQHLSFIRLLIAASAFLASCARGTPGVHPRLGLMRGHIAVPAHGHAYREVIDQCTEMYYEQTLDHFNFYTDSSMEGGKWKQRYFFCDKYWKGGDSPIFFYAGNEADVTLYLNASGKVTLSPSSMYPYPIITLGSSLLIHTQA